jgi:superfamily I DNA/RNA helicase
MNLTAAQRQAVQRLGQDVCVTAGPGSGKTRVLVERFAWLVQEEHGDPGRILAITFTEKAALEIRQRLEKRFDGHARQTEVLRAPISTIDGFAARLLRESAIAAGLDPEFRILNEREAQLLSRQSADAALDSLLTRQPERIRSLYSKWLVSDPARELISCYEGIRLAADGWPAHPPATPDHETLDLALRDLDRRYRGAKRSASALDFGDLCELAVQLLETHPDIREDTAWRYDFILMDELQDTNPLQWRLMELVRRPGRFFGVGDINQAIYGFRHATPEGFRGFRAGVERSGGTVDRLAENFRSRPEILAAVEQVCGSLAGMERPALRAGREFPPPEEPAVEMIGAEHPDKDTRVWLEALAVCQRIQELSNRFRYGEMAILMRTRTRYNVFARALTECGIPFLMTDSRGFFERQEVSDCLNWLRALANPLDEIAVLGVARSPFGGMDDSAIYAARRAGGSLAAALGDGLSLLTAQRRRNGEPPDLLLAEALDATDYWTALDAGATANVAKFLELVRAAGEQAGTGTRWPGPTAAGAVEYLDRLRASGDEPDAAQLWTMDAVRVLTIHGAKGLEFPVVFLAGLDSTGRPDGFSLAYASGKGLGAVWRGEKDKVLDETAKEVKEANKKREEDEASRLLYVGMTRAEQKLILSFGFTRTPKTGKLSRRGWLKWLVSLGEPVIAAPPNPADIRRAATPGERGGESRWQLVARRPSSPVLPEAFSARTLALFEICPMRAYLEGVAQWPGPDPPPGAPALDGGASARSVPFAIEIGGVVVEGIAFFDAATGTARAPGLDLPPAAARTESALCGLALDRLGYPVRGLHAPSPANRDGFLPWNETEATRLQSRVKAAAAAAEGYPLREGEHCRLCPYWRNVCGSSYGAEQLALFE